MAQIGIITGFAGQKGKQILVQFCRHRLWPSGGLHGKGGKGTVKIPRCRRGQHLDPGQLTAQLGAAMFKGHGSGGVDRGFVDGHPLFDLGFDQQN